jgi:hypothetical protein
MMKWARPAPRRGTTGASLCGIAVLLVAIRPIPAAAEPLSDGAALDKAIAALQKLDWGLSLAPIEAIDQAILASHGDPAVRRRLEDRLAACLKSTAPLAAKQYVCRRLGMIGTEASLPTLAPLLTNAELSHMARFALERIPGPAVDQALREALRSAAGRLKVGIIASLGKREDTAAVPQLVGRLDDGDTSVATAAAEALGKIATPEAAQSLQRFRSAATPSLGAVATHAWIEAAERLTRKGHRAQAGEIFRQLLSEKENRWRLAGFRGLVIAEPQAAYERLRQAIAGEDVPLQALAARLIAETCDRDCIARFLREIGALPSAGQVALLDGLRPRLDAAARSAVREVVRSRDSVVRLAALRALAVIGDAADVPMLLELGIARRGEESQAARSALAMLPGKDVDVSLIGMLPIVTPEVRVEVIRGLVARAVTNSVARVS